MGWLGESRVHTAGTVHCRRTFTQPAQRRVAAAALLTAAWSVTLGITQLTATNEGFETAFTLCGNALLCCALYIALSPYDDTLAKALLYAFLQVRYSRRVTAV